MRARGLDAGSLTTFWNIRNQAGTIMRPGPRSDFGPWINFVGGCLVQSLAVEWVRPCHGVGLGVRCMVRAVFGPWITFGGATTWAELPRQSSLRCGSTNPHAPTPTLPSQALT